MAKRQVFHVESYGGHGGWQNVPFAKGTRQYCEGWVDAMNSFRQFRPYRIIRTNPNGSIDVVRETQKAQEKT